uniref:serine C-palmitoyltransferase n=1 Tax=Zea mays TaxID=4577 RepID=A0A804QFZ2_MAIZE
MAPTEVPKNLLASARIVISSGQSSRRWVLRFLVVVVTVAFPATPLLLARARICISASHTREDLIKALDVISRVGDLVGIKYFPAEPPKIAGADHDKLE